MKKLLIALMLFSFSVYSNEGVCKKPCKKVENKAKLKQKRNLGKLEANIKKIMKLTFQGSMDVMRDTLKNYYTQLGINEDVSNDTFKKITDIMNKEYYSDKVIKETVKIYEKHFTPDEIEEMTKFYESPLGKKVMSKTPVIMQEMQPIMLEVNKKLMEEITKNIKPIEQTNPKNEN